MFDWLSSFEVLELRHCNSQIVSEESYLTRNLDLRYYKLLQADVHLNLKGLGYTGHNQHYLALLRSTHAVSLCAASQGMSCVEIFHQLRLD